VRGRMLIDEFHLTLTVARATPDWAVAAARRVVNGRAFRAALRRAVRQVFAAVPALAVVRVTLSA
jgi:hypothetical protein